MTTYTFRTDAVSGSIEADSVDAAYKAICDAGDWWEGAARDGGSLWIFKDGVDMYVEGVGAVAELVGA